MNQPTILVPLDGSSLAEAVLPYADALARLLTARLHLLTVIESVPDMLWGLSPADRERFAEAQRTAGQQYLDRMAADVIQRGGASSSSVQSGEPSAAILAAGDAPEVMLIAMATHGRGGAARLVLGSVADKVMRLGSCPTLLVRTGEASERQRQVALKRIFVPLDGSELAEQALPLAEQLAGAAGATLVLARVERHLWQMATAYDMPLIANIVELEQQATDRLEAYLYGVRPRLSGDLSVEIVLERGHPALVLEELINQGAIDLVVMATNGRGGLRRAVIGSQADRMVRLGVPTLLVHPGTAARG
jgi:nucleotide-binding universal stress UspA family protein